MFFVSIKLHQGLLRKISAAFLRLKIGHYKCQESNSTEGPIYIYTIYHIYKNVSQELFHTKAAVIKYVRII